LSQRHVLVSDAGGIKRRLHVQHCLFRRFKLGIQAAQHGHGQDDDIAVLAAHVKVAEHIVSNAPDEVDDPIQLRLFHASNDIAEKLNVALARKSPMTARRSSSWAKNALILRERSSGVNNERA
jgi:hypothetical protein